MPVNPVGIGLFPPGLAGPLAAGPSDASIVSAVYNDPGSGLTITGPNSGQLFIARAAFANSRILTLNATPHVFIPGVLGQVIVPIYIWSRVVCLAGAYNTSANVRLRYAGIATDLATVPFVTNTAITRWSASNAAAAQTFNTGAGDPEVAALDVQLSINAVVTGGNAGNVGIVSCVYYRVPLSSIVTNLIT